MPPRPQELKVVRKHTGTGYRHLYHQLLTMPWTRFVLFFFSGSSIHAGFAFLYLLEPTSVLGVEGR